MMVQYCPGSKGLSNEVIIISLQEAIKRPLKGNIPVI